ncbi:DUF7322 domain-containing protein [Halovivax cerinus]|uniref:CAAX protease family protein n=1 Tax=Halovivax cerinus TaxID=1487865 RepID=A0ABD5NJR4_9EURY|nr:CAAX protease family protein [Halovivax cerinus]
MGLDDFELEPGAAEPDEWDPEDDLHDPDADGLTVPQVSTDESDVDSELVRTFWTIVLICNVAILLVSVGPMLWYFLDMAREGLALVLGGLVLFGLAYRRYRRFEDGASAPTEADTETDGFRPESTGERSTSPSEREES